MTQVTVGVTKVTSASVRVMLSSNRKGRPPARLYLKRNMGFSCHAVCGGITNPAVAFRNFQLLSPPAQFRQCLGLRPVPGLHGGHAPSLRHARLRICGDARTRGLAVSEPEHGTLAEAIHYLKLSFSKRLHSRNSNVFGSFELCPGSPFFWANLGSEKSGSFWQKRYYDRNVRDAWEFKVKLRCLHRNRVKRGLVKEPGDWKWSSFRHYVLREKGVVEIESEWTAQIVN